MMTKSQKSEHQPFALRNPSNGKAAASAAPSLSVVRPLGLKYWEDPYAFVNELDRQFEHMRHNMEALVLPTAWGSSGDVASLFGGLDEGGRMAARVDLQDTGTAFVVEAELPGFAKQDVEIQLTEQGLAIAALRSSAKDGGAADGEGYLAHERAYASLARFVNFPEEINADAATAQLKDGLLTVKVPKRKPTARRKARTLKIE